MLNNFSVLFSKNLFYLLLPFIILAFFVCSTLLVHAKDTYELEDVATVSVVVTSPISNINPDGKQQYVITLKDGSGHIVSRNSGLFSAFEYALRQSGYVGDIQALLRLAEGAETKDVLRATLLMLQEQLKSLQEQLASKRGTPSTSLSQTPWCITDWTRPLKVGDEGQDVLALQKFLNSQSGIAVASIGSGSPGFESTYFGEKTATALARFQEQHQSEILTPLQSTDGTGYFGALTQGWIERACGIRKETGSQLSVPLDKLNRESDSECYSGSLSFSEGAVTSAYTAPNGLNVKIQNGYFKCEVGEWKPKEY